MRLTRWLLVFLAGCGAPAPRPSSARPPITIRLPFPPQRVVEELARAEVKPLPRREVAPAAEWRVEPAPERSAIESRFSGMTFTKELRCVAREYGRLRAEKGAGQPDERLEGFIDAACGVPSPTGATAFWKLKVPESTPDDEVVSAFTKTSLPEELRGRPLGAWISRRNDLAILTLVSGGTGAPVTITLADSSGRVTVEGTADVDFLGARINRGRDGTAPCDRDATAKRPAFRFTCVLAESDPWAWVQILSGRSEEALVTSRALVIARRDATTALELRSTEPGQAAGNPERVLLDRVNRARQAAKLGPVGLAPRQSATNAHLAPHFFRAALEHDDTTSEEIARGAIAGWDVDGGPIRAGQFFGLLLTGAKSPESWLDFALETPLGRYVLLERDAEQIAIGLAPSSSVGGMGAVVTTYDFFTRDRRTNESVVYQRIAQVRAARKLPAATSLPDMPVLDEEMALVASGKRNPRDVLDIVLARETRRQQRALGGVMVLVHDLEHMSLASEVLAPGPLAVKVGVTSYQPERSPWGFYLVYVVTSVPE